jgi:hypothetical protein
MEVAGTPAGFEQPEKLSEAEYVEGHEQRHRRVFLSLSPTVYI